jgi:uncharacterized protein YjbI with pentapeptide repeats
VPDALVLDDGEAVGMRIEGARHAGELFERVRLSDVEFVRCDLSGCDFSEAIWQKVTLLDCRCSSVELPQASLKDVTFKDCKLDDANLRLAKLQRVRFDGCVLAGAEFISATLEEVTFPGSDLAGADLTKVRCADVDLRDARLDGLQGIDALKGCTIGVDQLFPMAPALAQALGITVKGDDD